MQDQQVRRSCHAIATQLLLSALPNAPATRPNSSTADHAVTKSEGDDRTRALRRLCETVVSDAMTLYRLCHRAGGAETRIVVLGSSSSSTAGGGGGGGGGGSGNLVEEAAFCVCATIMAREPKLWSSLLRRAQLLRPRRPTLTFAVPVVVAPIVVADVVKFFGRSRHLVPAGVSRGVGLSSAAGAVTGEGESGTGSSTGGDGGVLSDQQAEAVAASFFFKTMTVAERQRRPEVLSIELPPSRHKAARAGSAAPPASAAVPGLAPAATAASPSPPPPLTAAATAREAGVATGYGAAQRLMLAAQAAQPSRRRTARAAAASSTVGSALLAHDDWAGWGRAGDPFHADGRRLRGVTEQGQAAGGRDWGVHERSSSGSSSSDSSDDDRSISSGDGGATRRGDRHQTRSGGELAATVSTHHRKQRKTQAAEAAVLERLYHLATAAEDKEEEEEEEEGDDERDGAGASASGSAQGKVDGGGAGASGRPGLYSTAAAASTSLFASGGRHLGMVALAAMTAQVQDELHWGRLTALVRCPLLFRGLSAPTLLPHAGLPSASCGVALSPTSDMLSAGTLANLANALGDAYSSAVSATESAPSAFQSTGAESAVQASLDALLSRLGPAGSFFCPARLRTSSLLPRPPSLVTDGFLWTRLLICAAWLTVYANGLVGSPAAPSSGPALSSPRRSARTEKSTTAAIAGEVGKMKRSAAARPRIRSSPLVRELVTYCVAVVREARAISAARTDTGEAHSVCCPVCDRLIKEQQPILWWSTLRDDRALLRRHVSTLLESGSSTAAEAEVSAAVAADGVCDRRGGGRAYAAPLLRGSRAAGEQVAALQEQWAAYIMGGPQSGGGAAATNAGEASAPTSQSNQRGDSESAATLSPDGATPMPTPQTEVVWAALTQRVAAAADLCAFLATHPLSSVEAAAAHPSRSLAANVGRQRVVSRRGRRGGGGGGDDDRQRRKRARRATSSDSSPTSSDEEGDGDEDSGRIAADRTDGESGGAAPAHHTRDEELGTSRSWGGPPAAPSHHGGSSGGAAQQGGRNTDRGSGVAQGSRHATAVAAEWEALLRRCGWVNAAPPRQPLAPPNPSAVAGEAAAATAPSAAPAERSSLAAASSSASSPEARLCSSWARSLIQPTAMPNAAQAAVLRRRLSRYRLHDVVRILVLGRGVEWERYAALLFGEDAVVGHPPRSMANNASSAPPRAAVAAVAAAPQRAASMSLLLDDSTVDGSACVAERAEERRRSLLGPHDRQRLSPDLLGNSAPPPQQQQQEPRESLSTSPRPSARPDAATTPRKSALLSIPLHVSPLKRHTGAVASTQHTAVRYDGHGPEEGSQEAEGRTGSPSPTLSTQQQTAASQVCRHDGRRASSLPTQEEGGSPAVGCDASSVTLPSAESDDDEEDEEEALAEAQLRDQQTALRALLDFCPRFPPVREEDGVLECGSCFSLFHQDCIAPVQRDLMGQVFLCHTCRLRWARPCVTSGAGGGLIHQAQEQPR